MSEQQLSRLPEAARPVPQMQMYGEERGRFGGMGPRVPSRETDPRITSHAQEDAPKLPYLVLEKSYIDDTIQLPGSTVFVAVGRAGSNFGMLDSVEYPSEGVPRPKDPDPGVPRFSGGYLPRRVKS